MGDANSIPRRRQSRVLGPGRAAIMAPTPLHTTPPLRITCSRQLGPGGLGRLGRLPGLRSWLLKLCSPQGLLFRLKHLRRYLLINRPDLRFSHCMGSASFAVIANMPPYIQSHQQYHRDNNYQVEAAEDGAEGR